MSKFFHADKFNLRVLDAGMRKENDERFSALTTALKALEEWSDLAIHKERRPLSEQKNTCKTSMNGAVKFMCP